MNLPINIQESKPVQVTENTQQDINNSMSATYMGRTYNHKAVNKKTVGVVILVAYSAFKALSMLPSISEPILALGRITALLGGVALLNEVANKYSPSRAMSYVDIKPNTIKHLPELEG